MAQSALRNLPLERMNARRARAGMEAFVPQAPTKTAGQAMADMLGGMSIPLSFVPVAGDFAGLAADAAMYATRPEERTLGNAAMTLAGIVPGIPGAAAIRAGGQAAEGALDMSQAARMQRADEMAYMPETYYHASTSDFDEFRPKYDDGLTFITPNPEFANKWLGKGGSRSKLMQARVDSPFYKQYKAEEKGIRGKYAAKYGDDIDQWPEAERAKYWQESRNLTRQYDATDQVIYPLRTNVQNTFDPRQHEDVIVEFLKSKGRDPMASTISRDKTDLDYYKTGNYLLFETPEMVQFLKNKGFDSMRLAEDGYNNGAFDTLAVFNPANIRSVNAAFDPAKRSSANLTAGILGGAVGLSALRNIAAQREQE